MWVVVRNPMGPSVLAGLTSLETIGFEFFRCRDQPDCNIVVRRGSRYHRLPGIRDSPKSRATLILIVWCMTPGSPACPRLGSVLDAASWQPHQRYAAALSSCRSAATGGAVDLAGEATVRRSHPPQAARHAPDHPRHRRWRRGAERDRHRRRMPSSPARATRASAFQARPSRAEALPRLRVGATGRQHRRTGGGRGPPSPSCQAVASP